MDTLESPLPPPTTTLLRPMGIAALLDQAVYFYRTHFLTLISFVGLFMIPFLLLNGLTTVLSAPSLLFDIPAEAAIGSACFSYIGSLVLTVVGYVITPIQIAGVGVALRGALLEQRQVSLGEMLAAVRANISSLVGTAFLALILGVGLALTLILPPFGLAVLTLYGFAYYLASLVVIYEKRRGLEAIRRGWLLMRGSLWRVLGYFVLFYIFSLLFGAILGGLIAMGAVALSTVADAPILLVLAQLIAASLVAIFFNPLQFSVAALLYFDLRVRHEGLDVTADLAAAAGEPLDLSQAPVYEGPVLTRETWRVVGTLSAVYLGILLLFCGLIFLLAFIGGM